MCSRPPLVSALSLTVALTTVMARSDEWPQFRGPRRDGISTASGLYRSWPEGGPRLVWRTNVGPGYAGPAIYGSRVYLNDYDTEASEWLVRCFALADGKELWKFREPKLIRPNHLITRTVPAVDGSHVIALDPKCVLHALDAETGKEIWQKSLVKEFGTKIPPWYAGQCPLMEERRVIVAPGGDKALMVALETATGKEIWRTPNPEGWLMSHASPMAATLCGVAQYLYATLNGIQGIAADDGRLLWFFPWKLNVAVAVSPLAVGDDRVFMTNQYDAESVMIRLSRDGGSFKASELFRFPPSKWNSEVHTPVLFDDHLFAVGKKRRGLFTCLDLQGEIVWQSPDGASFELGSFLLADGMFFALEGKTGALRLIEASTKEYRELARAQVLDGHDVWGPMALADGRLVLRDTTTMICLEVGKAPVATSVR